MICSLNSRASFNKLRSVGISNRLGGDRRVQYQFPLALFRFRTLSSGSDDTRTQQADRHRPSMSSTDGLALAD